jgi:hypothetical protein
VPEVPALWARAAIRLIGTSPGWIQSILGGGSGWLNQFDSRGRLVEIEQVWWNEERHPSFLDVDLASGLTQHWLIRPSASTAAHLSGFPALTIDGAIRSRWLRVAI